MVCEYNGIAGFEKYLTATATNNPNSSNTNYIAPTTQASNVNFTSIGQTNFTANWTRGDGTNCIVFIAQSDNGTALPVDNITYAANSVFGSGAQIGSSGWYCVYKGISASVAITGLTIGLTYRVMVIEFNGTSSHEKYLTTSGANNPANQVPDYQTPVTQASNITFSSVNYLSFTSSWTRGNGTGCVVFMKQGTDGSAAPVNNTTYTANAVFTNGTQIGTSGWYCIYKGTGTSIAISGLSPNQTYRVMACEYNGIAGYEKYLTATSTNNPNNQTTLNYAAPTTQAKNIVFSSVDITSFTTGWTRGNGSRCAVFIMQGNSGSASPVNGTTYTANTVFGSGSQIGTSGWYCVYDGTGTFC